MKNGGWLDNYGTKENPNDSSVSLPEGFVGMGNNTKGRDYSPAWGGQFQMGGKLTFLQPTSEKLPEGYIIPYNTPSSERAMSVGGEDGEPAYLIPSFKYGKPLYNPIEEFKKTGEHLGGPFKTWQEADEWERTVRHPYVEQGKDIPLPIKTWGEMAMGGSIPGAVGFSYARTKGIPSEGPYAKKTMPSAQEGRTITIDEGEGKKRKILTDSSEYAKLYDEGRIGVQNDDESISFNPLNEVVVTPYDKQYPFYQELSDEEKKYFNSDTPIGRQLRSRAQDNVGFNADKATDFAMGWLRDLPLASLQAPQSALVEGVEALRGNDFNMLNALEPDKQRIPSETWGIENPYAAFAVDALTDPETLMGMSLLKNPLQKGMQQAGRYLTEETALNTLPKAKNFREALGTFRGIPTERSLPRLSPEELKTYRQVQEIGRMRATNKPISEQYRYALDQNIPDEHFEKVFGRSKSEVEQILPSVAEQEAVRSSIPIRERFNLERTPRRRSSSDAVIDQMNNQLDIRTASPEEIQQFADSVGMSVDEVTRLAQSTLPQQTRDGVIRHTLTDYGSDADIEGLLERTYNSNELRPIPEELIINTGSNRGRTIINSQNPRLNLKETAIDDWQRYVDNKVPTSEVINDKFANIVSEYPYYKGPVLENVPSLSLSTSGNLKNVSKKVGDQSVSGISSGDVFTGSLNTSHNSYLPQIKQVFKYNEGTPQFLGYKPMNHLGFLSDFRYSQDDIAKYLNTEIDQQISRGVIPDNIQRPYVTKKDRVILPHYGIKQFKEGGNVIKDDLGQWKHPGQITEINSPYITMKGVPYPVLGISDTGDTQMMYPEEEYEFEGNKVTEYPLAKNGKELVKLNQLTNFTNYNTKQPGGWLDKY
jgi:hypothetical protein